VYATNLLPGMRVRKEFGIEHKDESGTVVEVWDSSWSGQKVVSVRYDGQIEADPITELPESLKVLNA
jgi:hypothetical protein